MARSAGSSPQDKSHTEWLLHRPMAHNVSKTLGSSQADHEAFPDAD